MMNDKKRNMQMLERLETATRQMQQLLSELDEVLELQAQLEAAGLTTDDLDLLTQ